MVDEQTEGGLTLDVMAGRVRKAIGDAWNMWPSIKEAGGYLAYTLTGLPSGPAQDSALADILARLARPADRPGDAAVAGIYMASKAVHGPRWRKLRDAGWPIISTWIDEAEPGRTTDWAGLWDRCASEPARAAVTVLYAEEGEMLKGALAEVGAALSHGRRVIVVGPIDHTWMRHRNVHCVGTLLEARELSESWMAHAVAPTPPAPVAATGLRIVFKPLDGPGTEFVEIKDADGQSVSLPSIKRPDGLFEIHVGLPAPATFPEDPECYLSKIEALVSEYLEKPGITSETKLVLEELFDDVEMIGNTIPDSTTLSGGAVPAGVNAVAPLADPQDRDLQGVIRAVVSLVRFVRRHESRIAMTLKEQAEEAKRTQAVLNEAGALRARLAAQPGGGPVAPGVGQRKGDWIQTFTGRQFWPMDPRADDVQIEDVAHALAMACRYAGHCKRFYSVAEHSMLLASVVAPEHKLWALLHDASEAYLVDVPRPVKPFLAGYREAEDRVMAVICQKFGLAISMPAEVKRADGAILNDERAQNMCFSRHEWSIDPTPLGVTLQFWSPQEAERRFLEALSALTGAAALDGASSGGEEK